LLGLPFSYRDERTSAQNMERAHARVGREELYARTGIQTIPINTVYQLATEAGTGAARVAEHIALVPDLLGLWLTGTLANELTIASTTGLLEARGRGWAVDLVERLGLPTAPFDGEVVRPGFELGAVLERHAGEAGAAVGSAVRAVGGHDTASAFVAAPITGAGAAVLSSGTWSLLGVELPDPELGPDAAAFNLTNERGVCDTVRLLRNVMGLWLVQECRRVWREQGSDRDYDELQRLAVEAPADVAVFDPDHDSLLHGGDMPARIAALCSDSGQATPSGDGELLRAILLSLACKYRLVCEQLEHVCDRTIDTIHVVGGGARNELLCQLTADVCGREVVTGPAEATALGNVLVQAMALGELDSLDDVRRVAARSVAPRRFEPQASSTGNETYQRFVQTTGLSPTRAARAPA
jgi:rhamnulokinase